MTRSLILGTGMAVPDRIVTNDELSAVIDTTDEWITQRTGIRQRHWVREGETGVDLAERASRAAMAAAGLADAAIDAIVWPPPRRITSRPATACCSSTGWASAPFPPSTSGRSAAASSMRWRRRMPASGRAYTVTCWWWDRRYSLPAWTSARAVGPLR